MTLLLMNVLSGCVKRVQPPDLTDVCVGPSPSGRWTAECSVTDDEFVIGVRAEETLVYEWRPTVRVDGWHSVSAMYWVDDDWLVVRSNDIGLVAVHRVGDEWRPESPYCGISEKGQYRACLQTADEEGVLAFRVEVWESHPAIAGLSHQPLGHALCRGQLGAGESVPLGAIRWLSEGSFSVADETGERRWAVSSENGWLECSTVMLDD
jgi:hypothetical protein